MHGCVRTVVGTSARIARQAQTASVLAPQSFGRHDTRARPRGAGPAPDGAAGAVGLANCRFTAVSQCSESLVPVVGSAHAITVRRQSLGYEQHNTSSPSPVCSRVYAIWIPTRPAFPVPRRVSAVLRGLLSKCVSRTYCWALPMGGVQQVRSD